MKDHGAQAGVAQRRPRRLCTPNDRSMQPAPRELWASSLRAHASGWWSRCLAPHAALPSAGRLAPWWTLGFLLLACAGGLALSGCRQEVYRPIPPPPPRLSAGAKTRPEGEPVVLTTSPACVWATAACAGSRCRANVRNDCSQRLRCSLSVRTHCSHGAPSMTDSVQLEVPPSEMWSLEAGRDCKQGRIIGLVAEAVRCRP